VKTRANMDKLLARCRRSNRFDRKVIATRVNVPRGGSISGEGNSVDFLFAMMRDMACTPPRLAAGPAAGDVACSAICARHLRQHRPRRERCHHPSPFPAGDPGTTPETVVRIASLPARTRTVRVRRR
jgi:hypothetical protein